MKKKIYWIAILLLVLGSCSDKNEPPNIIIIYADDLGYGDVQAYNPENGKIPTPNIDRLAAQGMRFTDAHSSSAVCSPSRYTLLTGRYHWRTRLQKGIVGLFGPPLITPDRLTVGGLAKQHGYQTACIGKWHLGWNWPIPQENRDLFRSRQKKITATDEHRAAWKETFSQPIPGGPTAVGFDEYFGTDVPNWPPFCFIENDRTMGIPIEFGAGSLFGKNQASLQGPSLKNWKLEDVLPALGDRSVDFIERMAKSPDPFLLYLPLTSPHTPLSVNKEWKGKSGLGLYADLVMETDAIVGQVLEALEKNGEADNTLIVFTSDNGCAPYVGNTTIEEAGDTTFQSWRWDRDQHGNMPIAALEAKGHYPSGPLRGYKSDVWEGGHRVPFIVRWPGEIAPGSSSSQLIHQADIMATLADILGVSLPPDAGEDSFSLLPLLQGDDHPVREDAVSASISGFPSLRMGSWKLILGPGSCGWSPGGDEEPVQLYNLANDLRETTNLAGELPDRVSEMKTLMEKLVSEGRSTPGPKQENDVEVKRYDIYSKAFIKSISDRVNQYQLANPWKEKDDNWIRGTYYTGVMAVYQATGDAAYLQQCDALGENLKWQLPKLEPGQLASGANLLTCGQTWLESYMAKKKKSKIRNIIDHIENPAVRNPLTEPLVWYFESGRRYVDGLFTGPPTLAMLYRITGEEKYLDWMDAFVWDIYGALYDREEGLFYRDIRYKSGYEGKVRERYVRPDSIPYEEARTSYVYQKTKKGNKVIWSRGNGWAFAGLARMLKYVPQDKPNYEKYKAVFNRMASALKDCQRPDGFWYPNLADPDDYGTPESSGTGFFTYGLAWGINNGLLSPEEYLPVVKKSWAALVSAVSDEGKVQFGQPVGAAPYKVLKEDSHEYVSGMFLLAASEMFRLNPQ